MFKRRFLFRGGLEPNQITYFSQNLIQDCVLLNTDGTNLFLFDDPCTGIHRFICEVSLLANKNFV
jgi:hypothetical protein